ncbi:MAG TPA: response regulator, partial [Nitrospirae bacterium]|nr:response regulator [Nitrospirota bacterium]
MLKIMLIDDDPNDRLLVVRELSKELEGVEFEHVTDPGSFSQAMQNDECDLIITDYSLRWSDGLKVLKEVKSRRPDIPIIMFTGTGSEEIAVKAMKMGLDDYVLKSSRHYIRLVVSVKAALERAEDRARFSVLERRYHHLFNNLPLCVYRTTMDGDWLDINRSGLDLFGFGSMEELIQKKAQEMYCDGSDRVRLLETLTRDGGISGWRVRMFKKDGSCFWAKLHSRLVRDEKGDALYIDGIIEDITRLVEAENELRQLVSTLDTVVEHIPEGIVLLGEDHEISLANPAAEKYRESLLGAGVGDKLEKIAGRAVEQYLVSPPAVLWHSAVVDGPPRMLFELAGRRIGESGSGKGMVLVFRDVTGRKEFEEKVHSQEKLAAVGQLAAGIAHDFNNILTGIIGYSEMLLLGEEMDVKARQKIEAILSNSQKAAQLVRQVLDFSRKSLSIMGPLELKGVIKEFLKFIERTIPENIHITFESEDGSYIVNADETKIQQVLANLAVNAKDAMPEGGELQFRLSKISVSPGSEAISRDMQPGDWVAVTVADSGSGIPPAVRAHIFEPFFTTKGISKGTGLGLSQVYGIVKQHKGFIDVQTETGKGTGFIIYLPSMDEPSGAPGKDNVKSIPKGHGETILVAEDDNEVLELFRAVFAELGYKLLAASNGKDAVNVFQKHLDEINLVITDLIMPE